ncbi:MAG: hypothetical protein C0402_15060 [Thermodesulfovibrio sp.]|nr:hypothetical protein [Thermodesulfovibrio sp.]
MSDNPLISVIVPLYNHEKYIAETIRSVLSQSHENLELIIVNDGSSDGSEKVAQGITDSRIRYYTQENQGAPQAINRGIALSRGEYISILNSDDVYAPTRLEDCLKMFACDESLSAVFSHLEFIDGEGQFIKYLRGPEENWENHKPGTSFKAENNIVLDLLAGNFLTTTSNLFCRRNVFDSAGYFTDLRYAHDYEFFLRLCSKLKTCLIEKPLLKYRVHASNTVKESEAAVNFEVGLVLSDFLFASDLPLSLNNADDLDAAMTKFLNSVKTCNADRMILTLLLFRIKYPEIGKEPALRFMKDPGNPFREACIKIFSVDLMSWRQWHQTNDRLIAIEKELSQGWIQWQETNDRLITRERELSQGWSQWQETNDRLITRERELSQGWIQWQETNDRLITRERELSQGWSQWQETNDRLIVAEEALQKAKSDISALEGQMQAIHNSSSYRWGRLLTWPLRKLTGGTEL